MIRVSGPADREKIALEPLEDVAGVAGPGAASAIRPTVRGSSSNYWKTQPGLGTSSASGLFAGFT